jgi:uncharacterized BrkB/YihY/UPF0761 family membrane protein
VSQGSEPPRAASPAATEGTPNAKPGRLATARAGMTRAQTRAQETYRRLETSRATNQLVDTGFHLYERDLNAGGGVLAGALAFRLFVFAIPYVFLIITVFGSAADLRNESGQDAARTAGLTGLIGKAIADAQRQSNGTKILSVVVGLMATVFAARAVVKTLRAVTALAWRVPLTRLKHSTRASLVFILILLATSVFATLIGKLRNERPGIGVLAGLASILVWAGAWLLISWFLPHAKDVPWKALVPGAVVFGVLVWSFHLLTVFYFSRKVSNASDTYGAIGSAVAIIVALYLFGRAMSASAVVNATLWERRQPREQGS